MYFRRASGSGIMASIKRSFAAPVQRRRASFENSNSGHDADAFANQPLLLKQQDKKKGSRRGHRDRGGNPNFGSSVGGNGDSRGGNSSNMSGPGGYCHHNCPAQSDPSGTSQSSDAGSASNTANTQEPDSNTLSMTFPASAGSATTTEESAVSSVGLSAASTIIPSTTGANALSGNSASSSGISPSSQAAIARHSNKTGAIVGGVLGGLVFLILLILATLFWLRRRQRKRTPASAEFRDRYIPRSTAPPMALAAQRSEDDLDYNYDGPPPPFTKGDFNDPLFEKIRETQQDHVRYGLAS